MTAGQITPDQATKVMQAIACTCGLWKSIEQRVNALEQTTGA